MDEIESAQNQLKEQEKQNKEKNERLNYCAYESFEQNPFGKEWIETIKIRLYSPIGSRSLEEMQYIVSQNDFVRMILGQIEEHKIKINGGK
jgi:hypothetical protein